MLVACGLTVWVVSPVCVQFLGRPATLALIALTLLALGGMLVIHEPSYSRRTRRLRLVAIFGSIGAMTVLSLLPPRGGARTQAMAAPTPTAWKGSAPNDITSPRAHGR
jgi:thiol:disulfide interchange protein